MVFGIGPLLALHISMQIEQERQREEERRKKAEEERQRIRRVDPPVHETPVEPREPLDTT